MTEISNLEPKGLWQNFDMFCANPRPSKHEEKIRAAIVEFAKQHNIDCKTDEICNVILSKPATKGIENRKGIILQAHIDMVPQKNNDVKHDFVNDPIQPWIDGEWVRAKGNTLGADNGIGASAALAVLADDSIAHGPIEALLTIDEETGMTGAFNLKPGVLKGDILLNLDSETEGELYVGCAGGVDATSTISYGTEAVPEDWTCCNLEVKGLKGGHSGMDIILQRGNANKVLFRIIKNLEEFNVRLCSVEGGNMRNAIPREAHAVLACPKAEADKAIAKVKELMATIKKELAAVEDEIVIEVSAVDGVKEMMKECCSKRIVNCVYALPNAIYRMSDSMKGLVETSSNLAIVKSDGKEVEICCLIRSSVDTQKQDFAMMMQSAVELAEGRIEFTGAYSGWTPNMASPILKEMKEQYKEMFGNEAKVMAIHAGLECGILGGIYPNLDMISFGPTIEHPHSPDERVNIASVEKFWKFLLATLKNVPVK
ncbi:MAG: aminoacyl-histidine dipeptidase [Bacteroidales bacterium]|nr:aminoacyl-histidine dipeptidase [Bacteroidales bacterium]